MNRDDFNIGRKIQYIQEQLIKVAESIDTRLSDIQSRYENALSRISRIEKHYRGIDLADQLLRLPDPISNDSFSNICDKKSGEHFLDTSPSRSMKNTSPMESADDEAIAKGVAKFPFSENSSLVRAGQITILTYGDPDADAKILIVHRFYEIGREYEEFGCTSLFQVAKKFRSRCGLKQIDPQEKEFRGEIDDVNLRPLPKSFSFPEDASNIRICMGNYVHEAMQMFGVHFSRADQKKEYSKFVVNGLAQLFEKKGPHYKRLSEAGKIAWKICRHDLLILGTIKEGD